MAVTVFSQSFDTVLWCTTSRYYHSEYTKFDHRVFSSHPVQKNVTYGILLVKTRAAELTIAHIILKATNSSTHLRSFLWSEGL